ncbi:MAG: PHP domain-containing protein [Defluviitaleaceae bacterium]|nr:PHP domain-containing protein [Defluviitaleaceae bacterium]
MKYIDLHTHSTYSDGTFSPKELVLYAKSKGISAIALTDHDTIEGIAEAKQAGVEHGVEVVSGVEISTSYPSGDFKGNEFHILGLFISENEEVKAVFDKLKTYRKNRNIELIKNLNAENINISMQDVEKLSSTGNITKAHFSKALIEKGYAKSFEEAFEKFFRGDKKTNVPKQTLNPKEAIEVIHKAGGISILAHPFRYKLKKENLIILIKELKKHSLDGIEAIYSTHKYEEEIFLKELAKELNLKISGGSDFHGHTKPNIELGIGYGELKIPLEILAGLKLSSP